MTTKRELNEEFKPDPDWKFQQPKLPDVSRKKSKKGFTINEVEFTYIKSVRSVMMAFVPFEQQCQRTLRHAAANVERVHRTTSIGPIAVYDRYDYYWDLLRFIAYEDLEGTISIEEIDMQEAEEAIMAFMPESMRLAATLMGF